MSQDYSNRNDWLVKRYTPRVVWYARLIWNSQSQGTYVRKTHGSIGRAARPR